jgi:hypothetical protein
MLAAHLPLTNHTFTREEELNQFIQERKLEAAAYAVAAKLLPSLAEHLPNGFELDRSDGTRGRLAQKAIALHQEARSAEFLRQELKVIEKVNCNYEDLVVAPEDIPLTENGRAQERLEIVDWLDPLCNWDSSAPTSEQRMARRVREFLMERQSVFEEAYC